MRVMPKVVFCGKLMHVKSLRDECKKICEKAIERNLQSNLASQIPTSIPSIRSSQSLEPTEQSSLSNHPSNSPSEPTIPELHPTDSPSLDASPKPSDAPTGTPSQSPTTNAPSEYPTNVPSIDPTQSHSPTPEPPNLVIIYTDEQNFRTLGSYRKILGQKQGFVWGDNVKLDTPNIDSIADEGVLFSNLFTASPLCTPARASFFSGMYPPPTGAWENKRPLFDNVTTFAHVLNEAGWETGYLGKWHLGGPEKPGWTSPGENVYGFSSTKYM